METPSILITGASSGFGLLTARIALSRGWRVAATARRPEAIPLKATGDLVKLRLDVTERAAMEGAVEKAIAAFGALDAVVNNAGVANFGAAEEVSEEELRLEFETNFFGAVALTKTVLPHMRARGRGELVFVSSDWGRTGIPCYSGYCASKHALEGWAESLFHEVGPLGIGVTLIEPGAFDTGFTAREARGAGAAHRAYAALREAVARGFDEEGQAPTGEPVAEAVLRAAAGSEPRLRAPVGRDAQAWCGARFKEDEETFVRNLARRYRWTDTR